MGSKIKHISFSSLKKFENCPVSWWAEYVDGQKAPPTDAASFGSQFDQMVAHKMGLGPAPENPMEGVESTANFYLSQPGAFKNPTAAQQKIEFSPNQWDYLAESIGADSKAKFPFVGYIDLVSEGLQNRIVDLKTSSMTMFRPEWALQCFSIYSLAYRAAVAEIHLIVQLKKGINFARWVHYPDKETWKWGMEWVGYYSNLIDLSLNGLRPLAKTPGYWCDWCAVKFDCRGSIFANFKQAD